MTAPLIITPTPAQAARLNAAEQHDIQQAHPLNYGALVNRLIRDPQVEDRIYAELVTCCECKDLALMWIQDPGIKSVYSLCFAHGLKYIGHLERRPATSKWTDHKRQHGSRRAWRTS